MKLYEQKMNINVEGAPVSVAKTREKRVLIKNRIKCILIILFVGFHSLLNAQSTRLDTLSDLTISILKQNGSLTKYNNVTKGALNKKEIDSILVNYVKGIEWKLISKSENVQVEEMDGHPVRIICDSCNDVISNGYLLDNNRSLDRIFISSPEKGLTSLVSGSYKITEDLKYLTKAKSFPMYIGNLTSRYLRSTFYYKRVDD